MGFFFFFLFLLEYIRCGYPLYVSYQDISKGYPQHMFCKEIRKIILGPVVQSIISLTSLLVVKMVMF